MIVQFKVKGNIGYEKRLGTIKEPPEIMKKQLQPVVVPQAKSWLQARGEFFHT